MTEQKLDEITSKVKEVFRSYGFGNCVVCKNPDCDECNEKNTIYDVLDVLASVHNELYAEVTGEYYDYIFHWANLGYGGSPDDSMFKEREDAEINEALENMINSLRAVRSIECPCVGCKRKESDYCGLRTCCEEFKKWKEDEDGIHSEGEA